MKMSKILLFLVLMLSSAFSFAQNIKTVEAFGFGSSEKSALKDAYRNAVSMALSTLIEAEIIIKNEDSIEEKVIAVSAGFIEKSEIIEAISKNEQGVFSVKIKADIKCDKLREEISHYSNSETLIDMASTRKDIANKKTIAQAKADILIEEQDELIDFLIKSIDDYVKLWHFKVEACLPVEGENAVNVEISKSLEKTDYIDKFMYPFSIKLGKLGILASSPSNKPRILLQDATKGKKISYPLELLYLDKFAGAKRYFDKYSKASYRLKLELKNKNKEILATHYITLRKKYVTAGIANSLNFSLHSGVHSLTINPSFDGTESKASKFFKVELAKAFKVDDIAIASVKLIRVDSSTIFDSYWEK